MNPRPLLFDYWDKYSGRPEWRHLVNFDEWSHFHSPTGAGGLAKIGKTSEGNRDVLEILMIHSDAPGSGQLHNFIAQAKGEFFTIIIWEILNPAMLDILRSYGFFPVKKLDSDGAKVVGLCWSRVAGPSGG